MLSGASRNATPPRGYIAGDNNTKLSTYYHYQMLAQNFRGVYAAGTPLVNGAHTNNVKAFGAKDVDQIVVMLLNESKNPTPLPLSYSVRLNTGNIKNNSVLKVNIDAGVAGVAQYSVSSAEGLAPESTVMLVFDANGNFLRRYVYDLGNAQSDTEPSCTGATCLGARRPAPRRPAPPRRPRSPTERSG